MSVWGGENISNRLEGPDKAVKYTLDLTVAHNDESLIDDKVLQPNHAPFSYINVLKVGTGVWSSCKGHMLRINIATESMAEYITYVAKEASISFAEKKSPECS
jgi:hypothetical protein